MTYHRAADMTRAIRLVWLYRFFHNGGRITAADLAAWHGVSARTIQRDLIDLDSAGLVATIRDTDYRWRAMRPQGRRAG